MTFHVYILRDSRMRALYVGQTGNLRQRMAAHNRAPFAADVALVSVIPCESRDDALAVERHYLWTLRPVHNIYGSPSHWTSEDYDDSDRPLSVRERKCAALERAKAEVAA